MSFRKSVLLVGCASLLLIAGLVIILITLGLSIGGRAVIAHSQPTPTPTKTPRPILTATNTPTPVVLAMATPSLPDALSQPPTAAPASTGPSLDTTMPSPTDTPVPADAHAGMPAPSPTPSPVPADGLTPTPTPTGELTPTPTLSRPGRITGRLLLDGAPVSQGVRLKLENQSYNVIAETIVGAEGVYTFSDLEPSSQGYNVVFAQEWNTGYGTNQVVSWGWLGPIAVENGAVIELPDLDVSLLGFRQVNPAPDAAFSAAALSSQNPIRFEWTAYPQAVKYWVDLVRGEEQKLAWQSLAQATSLAFDGTLGNGGYIQAGEYWWGVGARRELGPYKLTVYGYLPGLTIEP